MVQRKAETPLEGEHRAGEKVVTPQLTGRGSRESATTALLAVEREAAVMRLSRAGWRCSGLLKAAGDSNNLPHYAALKLGPRQGRCSAGAPLPSYNCLVICALMREWPISPVAVAGREGAGQVERKPTGGMAKCEEFDENPMVTKISWERDEIK